MVASAFPFRLPSGLTARGYLIASWNAWVRATALNEAVSKGAMPATAYAGMLLVRYGTAKDAQTFAAEHGELAERARAFLEIVKLEEKK